MRLFPRLYWAGKERNAQCYFISKQGRRYLLYPNEEKTKFTYPETSDMHILFQWSKQF
jgi:hypothetical protein